ncbi:DUF4121 family protein [Bacillus cereus]|uniref:Uncharacterized protein n=1 Tax=Bacillus cereus TaxID=1396 RepID=A0A164NXT6_BACCE|nr:DUF4121 family protein [Bacillus cereus]KZD65977.1 hypothetical protein B4088_2734 [Bacillus cereus]
MTYTIETFKENNLSYHMKYSVTQSDVDKANELVKLIEQTRDANVPKVGDIVEYTNKYGDYFKNAHIEEVIDENLLYICDRPSEASVSKSTDPENIHSAVGGGPWSRIPKGLKYLGKRKKVFSVWGHSGRGANGSIRFEAEVNVWEYKVNEDLEFTTKTHSKYTLFVYPDKYTQETKYQITSENDRSLFNQEEYEAWLKTFNGVEREHVRDDHKTVWTLKQHRKCIPLNEYLLVKDAVIDSELCNAQIQECKRVYKDTEVTTYLPYQAQKIKLSGVKRYKNAYQA